jgi:hypothetical protein
MNLTVKFSGPCKQFGVLKKKALITGKKTKSPAGIEHERVKGGLAAEIGAGKEPYRTLLTDHAVLARCIERGVIVCGYRKHALPPLGCQRPQAGLRIGGVC